MYHPMAPCPSCRRHVLASEAACPFCKATIAAGTLVARSVPAGGAQLSRAAAVALGLSIATMAACEPMREPALYGGPPPPPPQPSGRVAPPPATAEPSTTPPPPTVSSGRTAPPPVPVAMYGAPMPRSDAGAPFEMPPQPQAPAYGGPPPRQ